MMQYVLDTYAWVDYFDGNPTFRRYIEQEITYTASVSLTELIRSQHNKGFSQSEIQRSIKFITKKSTVLPISEEDAIRAGFIAINSELHFSDALIYSLSSNERKVVTGDKHFRGKPNVDFVG